MNVQTAMKAEELRSYATQFFTARHPELYTIDWGQYYEYAIEEREKLLHGTARCALGVTYGPDEHQVMDIFMPPDNQGGTQGKRGARPVVLFFHGGMWREGHPGLYDCLAASWLSAGCVFVSCGYRLMPEARLADSVTDACSVVDWWIEHAAAYGADPQALTISGHSAGGHLAAMVGLTELGNDAGRLESLKNVIVISGVSDVRGLVDGGDESLCPTLRIQPTRRSVLICYGSPEANRRDGDPWLLTHHGEMLDRALSRAGVAHQTIAAGSVTHIDTALMFGDSESVLFRRSAELVRGAMPRR